MVEHRLSRCVLIAAAALLPVASAAAQLTPDRTYNGVGRPLSMTVERPEGAAGELSIHLLTPGSAALIESAPVVEGKIDLAALFPLLWDPQAEHTTLYAQLVAGETKVGPAVVLQPMLGAKVASLVEPTTRAVWFIDPRTGKPNFDARQGQVEFGPPEETAYTGVRAYVDQDVLLETSLGEIRFAMRPDAAPNTVWNFRELVRGGFYDGVIFHRIVGRLPTGAPFVIQAGDPTGTGNGGPGYNFDLEPSTLPHDFGVISMARASDPNTNGSQFFVALSREGTARLDGRYAAFGQAIAGAETIMAIAAAEIIPAEPGSPQADRPRNPPVIVRARLVDAAPYGEAPAPVAAPAAPPVER